MRQPCVECRKLQGQLLAISARSARLHTEMSADAIAASGAQQAVADLERRIARTEPALAEAADRLQLSEQDRKDFHGTRSREDQLHREEGEALCKLREEAVASAAWRPETSPERDAAYLRKALERAMWDLEDARAAQVATAVRVSRDAALGAAELAAATAAAREAEAAADTAGARRTAALALGEDRRQCVELKAEIGDTRRRVSAGRAGLARLRALQREAETRLADGQASELNANSELARRLAEQERRACELEAENRELSHLLEVDVERNKAKIDILRAKAKKYDVGLSNLRRLYIERPARSASSRRSVVGGSCVRVS